MGKKSRSRSKSKSRSRPNRPIPKKNRTIAINAGLFLGVFFAGMFVSTLFSEALIIANSPEMLSPLDVGSGEVQLAVIDPNYGPIFGQAYAGNPNGPSWTSLRGKAATFIDPTGYHSPMAAYTGGIYMSDSNGNPIPSTHVYNPDYNMSLQFSNENGSINATEIVFHYQALAGFSLVVRSGPTEALDQFPGVDYTNPTKPVGKPYYLSPYYGHNFSLGGSPTLTFTKGDQQAWFDTCGALSIASWTSASGTRTHAQTATMSNSAYCNYVTENNGTTHLKQYLAADTSGPYAAIKSSLIPISDSLLMGANYNPAWDDNATGMSNRLMNYCFAKPVNFAATVYLDANSESIQQYNVSYPIQYKGHTVTVHVDTVDAVVGFEGKAPPSVVGLEQGLVANVNGNNRVPGYIQNGTSWTAGTEPSTENQTSGVNPARKYGKDTICGWIQYDGQPWSSTLSNGYNFVDPTIKYNNTSTMLADLYDLAHNAKMPKGMAVTITGTLAPKVTASWASYNVHLDTALQDGDGSSTYSVYRNQYSMFAPYAVQCDNYASVITVIVPITIISERNYMLFYENGTRIPISSLNDTALNALWLDPNSSNFYRNQTLPTPPSNPSWPSLPSWNGAWNNFWSDPLGTLANALFGQYMWIFWVIIGLVGVIFVYAIYQRLRGPKKKGGK